MRFDDYLRRVGERRPPAPPSTTLRRLHLAHRETFLFENLTIQTGRRISLALPDLERKFLDEGRGGYCFEHNTLFAALSRRRLRRRTTLLGRVRRGPPERWARTHMVLRVASAARCGSPTSASARWAWSSRSRFATARRRSRAGSPTGCAATGTLWILSMRDAAGVETDLYEFTEDPQTPMDVEVANHFTSTHPESIFRKSLTIQRTGARRAHDPAQRRADADAAGTVVDEPFARERLREVARELFAHRAAGQPLVFETAGATGNLPR